jgi:hypothetical protein
MKELQKMKRWFFQKTDHDASKYEPRPTRDWLMMLVVAVILTGVFFVAQYTYFSRLTDIEKLVGPSVKSATTTIDSGAIELIRADVQQRQADFAKWGTTTPKIVDPSL